MESIDTETQHETPPAYTADEAYAIAQRGALNALVEAGIMSKKDAAMRLVNNDGSCHQTRCG